uniref:Uncharacterized protein n=1 Tax=Nelumbo nucifera TaxID=4432 RepID=A0A822ZCF5_NELNU|nr:TPA_asm: hypothetical protein HUJ06_002134 [Nelumbo nucifera]
MNVYIHTHTCTYAETCASVYKLKSDGFSSTLMKITTPLEKYKMSRRHAATTFILSYFSADNILFVTKSFVL